MNSREAVREVPQGVSGERQKGVLDKAGDQAKGVAFWAAEKSTLVTLPATAVIVAFAPLTLAAAAPFMLADAGGFVLFRRLRNRRKQQK